MYTFPAPRWPETYTPPTPLAGRIIGARSSDSAAPRWPGTYTPPTPLAGRIIARSPGRILRLIRTFSHLALVFACGSGEFAHFRILHIFASCTWEASFGPGEEETRLRILLALVFAHFRILHIFASCLHIFASCTFSHLACTFSHLACTCVCTFSHLACTCVCTFSHLAHFRILRIFASCLHLCLRIFASCTWEASFGPGEEETRLRIVWNVARRLAQLEPTQHRCVCVCVCACVSVALVAQARLIFGSISQRSLPAWQWT